jgi:hypothetical protein
LLGSDIEDAVNRKAMLRMRPLLMLLAGAPLGLGAAACGSATHGGTGTAPQTQAAVGSAVRSPSAVATSGRGASDGDDADDASGNNGSGEKEDDSTVTDYGQPADAALTRTITAIAKRYFAAAAAADGAATCPLIVLDLVAAIPGNFGKAPNPSYMRGNTCAEVCSKLFKHMHRQLAAEAGGLEIAGVRATHPTVYVLMAFKNSPYRRYIALEREDGTWKFEAMLDSEYP